MPLRFKNSLGDTTETFEPLDPTLVRLYHCGPTVKEPIHIEKFRSFVLADVLRRHLEASGYDVRQVMNITDVGHLNEFEEDIVEMAAARSGRYAWELADEEERRFHEECRALHITPAHEYPRARGHVDEMIELARELEAKGLCYEAGGCLYLDSEKYGDFGKLSGKSRAELEELDRAMHTPSPNKRHPLDIALWRTDALHQLSWDSPWGRGFPGWHVECVAMSRKYLGDSFDIHTGTHDNVFPHHECEIAQAESLSGRPLARYWLHSGPVTVDGQAMTRRNDNVVTVRELLESGFRGGVIRAALLHTHYREPLDFGDAALDWARECVHLALGFREHLEEAISAYPMLVDDTTPPWIADTTARIRAALDDDLDYGRALGELRSTLESLEPQEVGNPQAALDALDEWDRVFGVLDVREEEGTEEPGGTAS